MSSNSAGKILIVYDSRAIRETVTIFGIEDEFSIIELDDPGKIMDAFESERPDAVVLCAMTKKTTAFEDCRMLKEHGSSTYVPVIIYSLKVDDESRRHAAEVMADDIIQVTISPEDLFYRIRSLFRIRSLIAETQQRTASIARASAEAADMMLQLEEADRRIREQNEELEQMVRELEERDRRIRVQQAEIEQHLQTLRQEMELASALQINLLPSQAPQVRGMSLHDRYVPAAQLCGDYYDYLQLGEDYLHISIADVTGHGVAPALVSVQVRTMARTAVAAGKSPCEVMSELNSFMFDTFKREFLMTMICLSFNSVNGSIVYCGAGHCPMYILRNNGEVSELPSSGMPLGVSMDAKFVEDSCALDVGEKLLLYTDGVFEVQGDGKEIFGPERLIEALKGCRSHTGHDVLDGIFRTARSFSADGSFEDDVTLVLLERTSID